MPSVALIVLRLEIEDGFLEPKSLNFVAEKYFDALQADDGNRTIDPTETEDKKTFLSDDKHLEKQTHRVNRIVSNFTVETYMEKDTTIDSNESTMEEDQSATAKPTQKEESLALPVMSGMKRSRTSPLPFFSGNPMVEHTSGILHLYKDNQMTPLDEDVARSEMICMMSVPAKLTCIDLQQFTQPIKDSIQHMQIIRDNSPNQYMVLLKFKDQRSADGFYKDFNGKPYNMLEPETLLKYLPSNMIQETSEIKTARLVYVAKMESVKSSEGGYLPVSGLTELPTCPVCLERMDESVEGILTILCNHSFHGDCLVQWSDSSCPVCRYSQTPKPVAEQRCFQCDSTESLWICLICGHIGCGRYKDLHAYQHYQQTSHTFSMQLENQRVWDYTGDNYVHRLVQSKSDGKLVAVDGEHEVIDDEKLDSLNLEYTYLLTSQLESQRLYFEEKMTFLEKDAMERVMIVEERMKKIFDDYEKLEQRVQHSEKEKKTLDKKYTQVVAKVGNLVRDLKEEKEMNSCLSENQKIWQQKFEETSEMMKHLEKTKNQEIADLNEQLRDLMRHLSIQSAVATASDDTQKELQDGQLFVQENQRTSSNKTKASPRGKGRATKER